MGDPVHFKGKDAIGHVAEAQARGILTASEIHGTEVPGHISAGADAARDTSVIFLLFYTIFYPLIPLPQLVSAFGFFALGWFLWRVGRASWLAWSRLERLHRVLEEEKWEIDHNRAQERDELRELYRAKGFEGKLLEDVLDVLMADGDRLLRVMVEEELGLTLESQEHPIKQGLGAGFGVLIATVLLLQALTFSPLIFIVASFLVTAISAWVLAVYAKNNVISAVVWNLALFALSFGVVTFSLELVKGIL